MVAVGVQSVLDPQHMAAGTTFVLFAFTVGGILGITISGATLDQVFSTKIQPIIEQYAQYADIARAARDDATIVWSTNLPSDVRSEISSDGGAAARATHCTSGEASRDIGCGILMPICYQSHSFDDGMGAPTDTDHHGTGGSGGGGNDSKSNKLQTWGNEATMNMNPVIYKTVFASQYFKEHLYCYKTYHEVLSEIQKSVRTLVPFFRESIPSTAFCLLLKLWTLRLTVRQVNNMLNLDTETSTPYPRAMALLYLRYVAESKTLWGWFEPWIDDDTQLIIAEKPRLQKTTIGKFARELLEKPKYQGTMLPRIPVKVQKQIEENLRHADGISSRTWENSGNPRSRSRSRSHDGGFRRDTYRHYHRDPSYDHDRHRRHDESPRGGGGRGYYSRRPGGRDSSTHKDNRNRHRSRSPIRRGRHDQSEHEKDMEFYSKAEEMYDEFGRLKKRKSRAEDR
ncbi:hypothetical protein EV182_003293 [Spiromyces aspiralis]|uniref:Uncharacterized protein n=1 Tax=Spiromyces aspiralis TaxID=68401 RepID=A0ACC1HEK8_9FUNG|nr:hypothetical protein EV182_003293 [Spiromyces aspiralis]